MRIIYRMIEDFNFEMHFVSSIQILRQNSTFQQIDVTSGKYLTGSPTMNFSEITRYFNDSC